MPSEYIWFPVQPGITELTREITVYENEYPVPANSVDVDLTTFDFENVPSSFWTDVLPADTPAIYRYEIDTYEAIPIWLTIQEYTFPVHTRASATRSFIRTPTIQPVAIAVRTGVFVLDLSARNVSMPVKTLAVVTQTVPAIRAAKVEAFHMLNVGGYRQIV